MKQDQSETLDDMEPNAEAEFKTWWASKEAEGYQYGREPLNNVRFGFDAGYQRGIAVAIEIAKSRDVLRGSGVYGSASGGMVQKSIVAALEAAAAQPEGETK